MTGQTSRHVVVPMLLLLSLTACGGIYLRDGVTDGDTFYLAERATLDSDPVLQSWVSYSLSRSACQLQIGGDNPARASSFDCELLGREHLAETWSERGAAQPGTSDPYLDDLALVREAGYLREYVAHYFRRRGWLLPVGLDRHGFRRWRRAHIPDHRPMTRLIGSWNYADEVDEARHRSR